jgi:TonB dependent receptor/TonB-dependent Receptor Plug Domain/Gram-negative bacterial TonB protein C-terminal
LTRSAARHVLGRLSMAIGSFALLAGVEVAGAVEPGHLPPDTDPRVGHESPVAPPSASPPLDVAPLPPEPVVTPPLVMAADVAYPTDATGTATVLLELVVDRDGAVSAVDVVDGEEPFASTASQAAVHFRFEPAQRDGQAVPARIRFEVKFTPPEPLVIPALPSEPRAAGAPPAPVAPGAPPTSVQVTEVQVFGTSAPGSASISQAEVRVMAGAMGDPFRAVSSMPGVGQLVTGLPVFFVRGAPPGNLGFLIDGVRVPLLFHAFLGPAVIHPRLIERIELEPGGYPASFGRFAGGVVSADLSQPRGEFNAEWSARLVDAGAFVDVPFAGGRGNVMLAGRYSYTALILSLLSELTLDYWDYQVLATYDLTPRDRIGVFAFGAYDYAATPPDEALAQTPEDGQNAVLFHRIDLRYDRRLGDTTKLRSAVTLGTEGTRGGQGVVRDRLAAVRLELRSQLGDALLLRAGASANLDRYELALDPDTENFLDVQALFPGRTDAVIGAYADLVIEAAPGLSLTPGLRVDRYTSQGNVAVGISPRLAASIRISPKVSIEHAFGIADQPPNFVPGVPGVAVAGLPGGLQRSVQTSSGVRAELPYSITSTTTLFNNAYFSLTDPFGQTQNLDLDADAAKVRSIGHAMGLELSLSRPLTRGLGASLAYTLSRSTRSYERIHTLAGYDRPHVLNLGASVDLGRHWLASVRSVLYSGVPGSRTLGDRRVFDQERARPFFRLDLRVEKRFVLSPSAWWAVVAEIMNASLSTEVLRRPCEPTCRDDNVGPIVLPSVGVLGQF